MRIEPSQMWHPSRGDIMLFILAFFSLGIVVLGYVALRHLFGYRRKR